jgi:hypothetical protein
VNSGPEKQVEEQTCNTCRLPEVYSFSVWRDAKRLLWSDKQWAATRENTWRSWLTGLPLSESEWKIRQLILQRSLKGG